MNLAFWRSGLVLVLVVVLVIEMRLTEDEDEDDDEDDIRPNTEGGSWIGPRVYVYLLLHIVASCCIADFESAWVQTSERLRIGNPRYSRLEICATLVAALPGFSAL